MFLKPPHKDAKPLSNRSTKGALTGKAVAKPKAFKKEDNEQSESPPPPKVVSPFVLWARAQEQRGSVFQQQVLEYLANGPPYLGNSVFDSKEAIKDLGARFSPNPAKAKDCTNRSIKRGWWSAPDEVVLGELLRMELVRHLYEGPEGVRGSWVRRCPTRHWACLNLVETQIGIVIDYLNKYQELHGNPPEANKVTDLQDEPPRKRARAWRVSPEVPEWILRAAALPAPRWLPDPTCEDCNGTVSDQFLDCGCAGVAWHRCPVCTDKYRTDGKRRCQCDAR